MNFAFQRRSRKIWIQLLLLLVILFAFPSAFTNADLDSENVSIENVSVYTLDSSVIIYWDTNILADSRIKYGISEDNLSMEDYLGVHSYAHASEITGLLPLTTYYFVVNSTNANGNSNESGIYYFTTLEDNESPKYAHVSAYPPSAGNFQRGQKYNFSAQWTDNACLENVTIIADFSTQSNGTNGTFAEYEMILIDGTNTYQYETENIPAGNYSWSMKAVDCAGNENSTGTFTYAVNKTVPQISLLHDGAEGNVQMEQRTSLNITALMRDGDVPAQIEIVAKNATSIVNRTSFVIYQNATSNSSVLAQAGLIHYFDAPGEYNISVNYNESQNFSGMTLSYAVNVTPIEVNLYTSKAEYVLGEGVSYVVLSSNSSNLSIEVCGPLPSGAGFVECKTVVSNQQSTYPFTGIHYITNKTGTYRMRAQIQYRGLTKVSERNYTVANNMAVSIAGETTLKIGDTSSLLATATGGVGNLKYNWTLSNGTKISGQNLNVKYNVAGSYPVVLTVSDDAGNYKTATTTLVFKKHYTLKFLVVDNADNSPIDSSKVRLDANSETCDEDGYASFDAMEGTYDLKASASGYSSYSDTIKSDSNKTTTIKLTKLQPQSSDPLEISLMSPANGAKVSTKLVTFKAYVDLGGNSAGTCMFYVAEDNNDWYRVMKTVSVSTSGEISYSEEFSGGNTFSWKVQCDSGGKSYSSPIWNFASTTQDNSEADLTILGSDNEIIDAGEIRRRIELALTNIDAMDMESKTDAEAIEFSDNVNRALRDYERAMRDISNIQFRKDLTEQEQEAKKLETYNSLTAMEDVVPLDVKNLGYQTFISYPTAEELLNISKEYQLSKNIVGRPNENALSEYQKGLIVTTRISNVEITYLGGKKEVITLVIKTIKLLDNSTDTFLLESIPKTIAASSDDVVIFSDEMKVINKDPLLKLDKQEKIIYYVKGEKDIEAGRQAKTILISDKVFSSRNAITGDVTFSSIQNINFTSPLSLIILIVIISGAYLLYAFDVFGGLFEKSRLKWKEQRVQKLLGLINDSSDALGRKDIVRANLIFKELQLMYEDSPQEVQEEVYENAFALLESIDCAQFDMLIASAEQPSGSTPEEKQKCESSRQTLKDAYMLLNDALREKYRQKIEIVEKDSIRSESRA